MKNFLRKTLIFFMGASLLLLPISGGIFAQTAYNVYFDHTYDYTFIRNDPPREVSPILVIDQGGGLIKASHGMRMIIVPGLYTLWDKNVTSVTATGSAVTNGKMDAQVTPVYADNLKSVLIPVKADFAKDEQVSIEGLKMRVYRTASSKRYIEMDITGDGVGDVVNFRSIAVSDTEIRTDSTPPYDVTGALAAYDGTAHTVTLTWKDPPDLDFERLLIERTLTRGGQTAASAPVELYPATQTYTDTDVQAGDSLVYRIKARDTALFSDGVELSVSATTAAPEPPVVPDQPPAEEGAQPEDFPAASEFDVTAEEEAEFLAKFPEVPEGHWALNALAFLTVRESVFSGYGDGTLRINNPVTRAEVAKIAWHAFINAYAPVPTVLTTEFTDVESYHWFLPYVIEMQERGIVKGYNDSTFRPLNPVNRAEALAILIKSAGIPELKSSQGAEDLPFTDLTPGAWYMPYVVFAYQNGFVAGFSDGTFRPGDTATRAQIAVMALKIREYVASQTP